MRILIDSDVLMDVALARAPHVKDSASILEWAENAGNAAVAWHSLANCAYLLKNGGYVFLKTLLQIVEVAPVSTEDARLALKLTMPDLEDAFQAAAALAYRADFIITRNLADYKKSPVPALSPTQFLKKLP